MPIALVSSRSQALGVNGGTTTAIDTTGASLLVLATSDYQPSTVTTISDSKGNTWTALTVSQVASNTRARIRYSENPTVGTSHTVTYSGTTIYAAASFLAFSGTAVASVFDQENGATASATSVATGSVTPSENGELVLSMCGRSVTSTADSVSSPFAVSENVGYVAAVNYGQSVAWEVQTTATARNPSFTGGTSGARAARVATFRSAAADSGTGPLIGGRLIRSNLIQGKLVA